MRIDLWIPTVLLLALLSSPFAKGDLENTQKPPPPKKTILDYFKLNLKASNETSETRQFRVKDLERGYIATQFEESALYAKADRALVLVINYKTADPPEVKAYELVGKRWKDKTSDLLPKLEDKDYILKRLKAKGLSFDELDDENPVTRVDISHPSKVISVVARRKPDGKALAVAIPLFRYVLKGNEFVVQE